MAGEREFLESLFGISSDNRMVGSIREAKDTEEEEYIRQLMDTDLEKLCMPLRVSAAICSMLDENHLRIPLLGASPSDGQVARGQHHIVQDCESTSILSFNYWENYRPGSGPLPNTENVSGWWVFDKSAYNAHLGLPMPHIRSSLTLSTLKGEVYCVSFM